MKTHVCFILLFLATSLLHYTELHAQPIDFSEIRETFLHHRPQTGDQMKRESCLLSIDEAVLYLTSQYGNEVFGFYDFMIEKAMIEIGTEIVEEGATIWQIFNHGYIVKTASVLLGFDLYDHYGSIHLEDLASSLDVLFISHNHKDHFSPVLVQAMEDLGKPVIRGINQASISINVGDSINEVLLPITKHDGSHSTSVNMFEVVTPEEIKILHTGDNDNSAVMPVIEDLDILLINVWMGGFSNALHNLASGVSLPGHFLELGHLELIFPPIPYRDGLIQPNLEEGCDYSVLAWGERYHYPEATNDIIRPLTVTDPAISVNSDSILISWDPPPLADDGESASFYRVNRDKPSGSLIKGSYFGFGWDTIGTYPVHIFSYDACGNQSLISLDFEVTVPDVNYQPRIEDHYPLSEDTVKMYSGVSRIFSVVAGDPNDDALSYEWEFDDGLIPDATSDHFIYDYSRIDTGIHQLAVIVSDQHLSRQFNWTIEHHDRMAVIDNSDTLMYSENGSWDDYPVPDAHNGTVRFTFLENEGDRASYFYYPEIPGYYDASIYIPDIPHGLSSAEYHVLINDKPVDTVKLNQDASAGRWNPLGQYLFAGDAEIQIMVINTGRARTGASVIADAVRFIYTEEPTDTSIWTGQVFKGYSPLICYPNPFTEYTTLRFENPEGYPYSLYMVDISGKVVRVRRNITGSEYILRKEGLRRGFYMIELRGPVIYREKLIVE